MTKAKVVSLWHWQLHQLQKFEDMLDEKAEQQQYLPSTIYDPWYEKLTRLCKRARYQADLAEQQLYQQGFVVLYDSEVVPADEYLLLQKARTSLGGGYNSSPD